MVIDSVQAETKTRTLLVFLGLLLLLLGAGCLEHGADTPPATLDSAEASREPATVEVVALPTEASTTATATLKPSATAPAATATTGATATPVATATPTVTATPNAVEFAVIGDYGSAGPDEAAVAALVHSWEPDLIITVGDNNYPNGEAATIDENIGQYYSGYIYPYYGQYTTTVSLGDTNRFFPSLGNHDYYSADGAQPYLDYFTLPGNERYYDLVWGPVHFFALNSDANEPDGVRADSAQGQWLQEQLAASTAPWKVVYMHVPPYSSGHHGSGQWMRWPFAEWGATVVMAGHDHNYERLLVDGTPYFVNGLGGGAVYAVGEPLPGSQFTYNETRGAMRVVADATAMTFEFVNVSGDVVDSYTISR